MNKDNHNDKETIPLKKIQIYVKSMNTEIFKVIVHKPVFFENSD